MLCNLVHWDVQLDGVGSRQIMPAVIKVNRPPEH